MQPIDNTILEIPGHIVLPVDYTVVLSNIMTALVSCNHRPARHRQLSVAEARQWRHNAAQLSSVSGREELAKLLRTGDGAVKATPISLLLSRYAEIAAMLLSEPVYVRDAGIDLQNHLIASEAWKPTMVSMPALGFARKHLAFQADFALPNTPFGLPGTVVTRSASWTDDAPTESSFAAAIADMCMLFDRAAFTPSLIPEASSATTRDARDPFFGQGSAALKQRNRLNAIGLLYAAQADVAAIRWTQPMFDLAYDITSALHPELLPAINGLRDMRAAVLAQIPAHPLIDTVANVLSDVSMKTDEGEKRAYVRHVKDCATRRSVEPMDVGLRGADGHSISTLATRYIVTALAEFARLGEIAASGESWPEAWIQSIAPTLSPSARRAIASAEQSGSGDRQDEASVTYSAALHRLASLREYVAMWPEITRILNWTSGARGAATVVNAVGCDFVLTDGDGYGDDPITVLAGLRPSLAISNPAVSGIGIRFRDDFGTGPSPQEDTLLASREGEPAPLAFEWSTLTAVGHLTALDGKDTISRFYLPPGMLMGESDGEPVHSRTGTATQLAVQEYYKALSPSGYVRMWAQIPRDAVSTVRGELAFFKTDWDAAAVGASEQSAQEALLKGYGDANIDADVAVVMFRSRWNLRFPVRLARAYCYERFDELGAYVGLGRFSGFVMFNGQIDASRASTASVDAVVNMLPVRALEGITVVVDEAKPPIDPSAI